MELENFTFTALAENGSTGFDPDPSLSIRFGASTKSQCFVFLY